MLLLLLTFVPHHHHHGIACVIMEHCELDNVVNDKHTSHNDAPDKGQQGQSCVAELEYIASTSDKEVNCTVSYDNHHHTHFYPILILVADFLIYNTDNSGILKSEWGEYLLCYKSAETSSFLNLRAPPALIS